MGDRETAQIVWHTLKQYHSKSGAVHQTLLIRELTSIVKTETMSMDEYFSKMINLNRKLERTGFKFGTDAIARFLISRLPLEKYEVLIFTLDSSKTITLDEVMSRLVADENRRETTKKLLQEPKEEATALASKFEKGDQSSRGGRGNHHGSRGRYRGGYNNRQQNTEDEGNERRYFCFSCNKPGHKACDCPVFAESKTKEEKKKQSKYHNHKNAKKADYSSSSEEEQEVRKSAKTAKAFIVKSKAFSASVDNQNCDSENSSDVSCEDMFIDGGASDNLTPFK